ncbi:MAG TPA: MFS transporter [Pseudonocardiaceae bacterium]|jgi:EmrB/QacA subfamily drug resistance transporter
MPTTEASRDATAGPGDSGLRSRRTAPDSPRYKWVALSNTTLGVLMATMNSSIVLISLPAIFRGIHINPLEPGNISYLLWMIMGYMLVTAVLVVTLGRLGDIYGRARIYNAGFAVFTAASILLAVDPLDGGGGALWLILVRVLQGVGGAMLMANATAILADAFPAERRGFAVGINAVAAIGGSFIGLLLGGVLSEVDWRLVFWVSVPFGVIGTIWAYLSLHSSGVRRSHKIDVPGNVTFAVGLILLLVGIIYAIQPYGGYPEGWTNPFVLGCLIIGLLVLIGFCVIESRTAQPMFNLQLFRIRAFAFGNVATLMSSLSRGGLQFMLIIWLQGIWLPLHGYDYDKTPLWSAIYMVPLTIGFLGAAPVSGWLSDRFGARIFATGGLLIVVLTFAALLVLPTDFTYWQFALILFVNGVGSGLFASPNMTGVMNSLPADQRGAGSGMMSTLQNSGMALSIGVFFSTLIAGLASSMPSALYSGLTAQHVPADVAATVSKLPPVGTLFAAFLGYNPMQEVLGPQVLAQLPPGNAATLVGKQFFPHLVTDSFHQGLVVVFATAIGVSLIGAIASLFRGGRFVHDEAHGSAGIAATVERSLQAAAEPSVPAPGPELVGRVTEALNGARNGDQAAVPARLTLVDFNGVQLARTQADPDGSFRLPGPPSPALLVFASPGHQPHARMVTPADVEQRHDVVLTATGSGQFSSRMGR